MTAVQASSTRWSAGVKYQEADWETTWGALFYNGVVQGVGNELAVYADSSGMWVKLPTGQMFIEGHDGSIATERQLPVNAYTGTTRLDGVVARRRTGLPIEFEVLPGINSTTLPTLTQDSSIWEELIASVLVDTNTSIAAGKVTDLRMLVTGPGGLINCLSTNRPAHKRGRGIVERDTQNRIRMSDGTNWLWVPGTGSVVGCNVKKGSTPQTLTTATWTGLTLDVENWDHASLHSGSDVGFVASASAIWAVEGWVEYAASGVNGGQTWASGSALDRHLAFHLNASAFFTSGSPSHEISSAPGARDATFPTRRQIYKEFDLTAGDHVSLVGRQDSGGNVDVLGATLNARIVGYNV